MRSLWKWVATASVIGWGRVAFDQASRASAWPGSQAVSISNAPPSRSRTRPLAG